MYTILPNTNSQTIKFVPRDTATLITVSFRDDQTNAIQTFNFSSSDANYNLPTATNDFSELTFQITDSTFLKEGHFYDIKMINQSSSDTIYKDRAFATAQTVNQSNNDYYTINKDEYIAENTNNNDYIVL